MENSYGHMGYPWDISVRDCLEDHRCKITFGLK